METQLIPEQTEGKHNDLYYTRRFTHRVTAANCFKKAVKRLLNPKLWHDLGGWFSGEFVLTTESGHQLRRSARIGDRYRIDLPGPATKAGNGFDWVKVDAIEDRSDPRAEEELFALRLVPTSHPQRDTNETAHFFQSNASSTFVVKRVNNEVTAAYHGRNELPNNHTDNTLDNLRNSITGSAAMAGLSELQWSTLLKGLLEI